MKTPLGLCLLTLAAIAGAAHAQDANSSWIGKRVCTQYGTVLKVGNDVVDDEGRAASIVASGMDLTVCRIYRVDRVKGEWLWLKDEKSSVAGWVQSKYAIPCERAVDCYTDLIRSNPSAAAYCYRGIAWDENGEHDKAIADFDEAIRLEPGDAIYFYNRGHAWDSKDDYDKAIADYSEAIRIDPKYASAFYNRGNVWGRKEDYARAINDYDEAIRIDPTHASAYSNRARLWATCPEEKYRDGTKAIESATRACELTAWKRANVLGILAASYAEDGQFDKAVEWQEKAVHLYSGNDKADWQKRLDLYRDNKPYRDVK